MIQLNGRRQMYKYSSLAVTRISQMATPVRTVYRELRGQIFVRAASIGTLGFRTAEDGATLHKEVLEPTEEELSLRCIHSLHVAATEQKVEARRSHGCHRCGFIS